MKTRTIIASALAFIMATTAAASSIAFAAGETVTISASKAETTGSFTIDVSLSGVPASAIQGCEFALQYDASVLSITDVTAGDIAKTGADSAEADISGECPAFFEDHSTAGTITLTWATGLSDKSYWISKDGVFATVSGVVAPGAAAGEYPIKVVAIPREDISGSNSSIYVGYNNGGTAVEYGVAVENGAVIVPGATTTTEAVTTTTTIAPQPGTTTTEVTTTIAPQPGTTTTATTTTIAPQPGTTTSSSSNGGGDFTVLYGDTNLDGSIGMMDVVYLNKYNAGALKFNEQQLANADCKKDGQINSADATALLKYAVKKVDSLPQ